ncbi:polysaccharide deacetylase family protein [Mariniluteicoccus endophyticus]
MKRPVILTAAATLALAGCGTPPPENTAAPSASASASKQASQKPSATPSAAPTPTASPTPAGSTELKSGANHNERAAAYAYPANDVHDWLHGAKEKSPTYPKDKKVAFLTFDDGPTTSTPKVLDALKEAGVPASFYIIAGPQGLEKSDPAILKRTIAEGHAVCIHTYSHSYKTLYPGNRASADNIVADYDKAVASVRKVLGDGYSSKCQRYPGGHGWKAMEASDKAMQAKDVWYLDWNSENGDGTDSAPGSGEGRAARAMSTLGSGPNVAVVLMHDYQGSDITVASVAPLVQQLKAKGYEFGIIG